MSRIIGTAGHVDHGKTALIKALTGMDTDRLKEEKKRGITIELGFAYLTLPGGERCGIIDVPGHEKFVRNMLAGAGSIDICLFVVAADEGLMPQSREHLEILTLLGVRRGIIVLTKKDVVEEDWLEMVSADVRAELAGTFLEGAPMFAVSARTGEGIEKLRQSIIAAVTEDDFALSKDITLDSSANNNGNIKTDKTNETKDTTNQENPAIASSENRRDGFGDIKSQSVNLHKLNQQCASQQTISQEERGEKPFRLHADRVFVKAGFGTVVTGTLVDGRLSLGDEVVLYPSMKKARVRSLQVHSAAVESAHKGQRVAVNLSGIKTEEIERGCVLGVGGSMKNADIFDVRLDIVKSTKRCIQNGSRLHLYVGTAEVTCKLVIISDVYNGDITEDNAGNICTTGGNLSSAIKGKPADISTAKTGEIGGNTFNLGSDGGVTGDDVSVANSAADAPKNGCVAGQSCYAQLRTDTPLAVQAGDRFVVRFLSPMETVGGGVILDPNPKRRSVNEPGAQKLFAVKEKGSFSQRVAAFILDKSKSFPRSADLRLNPFQNSPWFDSTMQALLQNNEVFAVRDAVIHKDYLAALAEKCTAILRKFSAQNPMLAGMKREELRSKLLQKQYQSFFDDLLPFLKDTVREADGIISLCGHTVALSEGQKRLLGAVEKELLDTGFTPPSLTELAAKHTREQKVFKQVVDALVASGTVIILGGGIPMHRDHYFRAVEVARGFDEFTLAQFRDAINASRKYAVALLESFDDRGITKKTGDTRILKQLSPH